MPTLLLLLLLLLLGSVGVAVGDWSSPCENEQCRQLAANVAQKMNASADPCEDFYEFACGGFRRVTRYDPARSYEQARNYGFTEPLMFVDSLESMNVAVERKLFELLALDGSVGGGAGTQRLYNMTREFYRSCQRWMLRRDSGDSMDDAHKELVSHSLEHLLADFSPLAPDATETLMARLVATGVDGLLSISLPPSFMEQVYLMDGIRNATRATLKVAHLTSTPEFDFRPMAALMGRAPLAKKLRLHVPGAARINAVRLSLTHLSRARFDGTNCSELVDSVGSYGPFSVADLQRLSECHRPDGAFSWQTFFEKLLGDDVDPEAMVATSSVHRLISIANFLKDYSNKGGKTDALSFLVADWLFSFAQLLPVDVRRSWESASYRRGGLRLPSGNGAQSCIKLTRQHLQPIVERMYMEAYHPANFADVRRLVGLVQQAAIRSVRSQKWVTEAAKEAIVAKVKAVKLSVGFDRATDEQLTEFYATSLDSFASNRDLSVSVSFGRMLPLGLCASARRNFGLMAGSSNVSIFAMMNPLVVNAYNFLERNQIIFPMAILAPPVFHPQLPDFANLGGLGYIIGHEIGHSFDNLGHKIDTEGAEGHFWDVRTETEYVKRMDCLRGRVGDYEVVPGHKAPANDTIGNDIADVIGIATAFDAWRLAAEGPGSRTRRLPNLPIPLSLDQQFFVLAAQSWCSRAEPQALVRMYGGPASHSANHLRVRAMVQNSQAFAAAFHCRRGQPMHPEGKCSFW